MELQRPFQPESTCFNGANESPRWYVQTKPMIALLWSFVKRNGPRQMRNWFDTSAACCRWCPFRSNKSNNEMNPMSQSPDPLSDYQQNHNRHLLIVISCVQWTGSGWIFHESDSIFIRWLFNIFIVYSMKHAMRYSVERARQRRKREKEKEIIIIIFFNTVK